MSDISQLAGLEFNGRQTGSLDDLRSANWVAERFRTLGLQPAAPNPLYAGVSQPWMMSTGVLVSTLTPTATLALTTSTTVTPLQVGTEFLPFLDSPSIDLTAPVTFVGYGIADPSRAYDDYRDIDVAGHIVLVLRGKPTWYEGVASHQSKAHLAHRHGAVAILTVTGPVLTAYEARRGVGLAPLGYVSQPGNDDGARDSLPGAWLSVAAADQILSDTTGGSATLGTLQDSLNHELIPRSRTGRIDARLRWEQRRTQGTLHNVVGYLEGSDPVLRQEIVVIGAHRDHFGRQAGLLFPGADDNASGTAVILEVARALTMSDQRPKRSILFVSFSGEELGLLGSTDFVAHPPRPLSHTTAMINIDHAGVGNGRLTVGVTGMDPSVVREAAARADIAPLVDVYGFFPGGDHVPFKEAGVPTVTVVSGGSHPHFHQPSDTTETIQPEVLTTVAQFVLSVAERLTGGP
ncbi:aminopeptidase [Nitrospira sp.]|nr:aminopeptidase [Nitrospira sp.]